jgi:hypothetical protein
MRSKTSKVIKLPSGKEITMRPIVQELVEKVANSGMTVAECALALGYEGEDGRKLAYGHLATDSAKLYLDDLIRNKMRRVVPKALNNIEELSDTAKSEYVRLQASADILDRAGYQPVQQVQAQVLGDFKVKIDLS